MPLSHLLPVIYRAVEEVNQTLPPAKRIATAPETPLRGHLDSLALVNLLVAVEEQVDLAFQRPVDLTNQRNLPPGEHPLSSLDSLARYVEHRLQVPAHG
jgi:acyl carrier protein